MEAFPESLEYRLLEAYHSRRRSRSNVKRPVVLQCDGLGASRNEVDSSKKRTFVLQCLRIPGPAPIIVQSSSASVDTGEFAEVADKLTCIVDSAPLAPTPLAVEDSDDVIKRLVELLKESGDKLNEEILRDRELSGFLEKSFSYSLFESLASAFIRAVVPKSSEAKVASENKTRIAWTFEMTSRLGALELQPMNKSMGFGARYLHQHFAPWIQQHGGWEKVFNDDESDEEIQ
ncbi:apoptosis facilitator Bcl-2-like protein 14 isoform X2 [Brachyhypopomus gauderio]|uniref:apoptosis facilitator Bcl-2-like protein 14 isoform X2 n=1 Tax=Brachyhypopomus gauderio TaxID=698409 RepID=UPI004041280E